MPYLNAWPLVHGLGDHVQMAVPSELAQRFAKGEVDVALIPVFEALSRPEAVIADDIAIASRGEVFSVFLASREPFDSLETIALDAASRTSVHLLKCLLAEFHELEPTYVEKPETATQARLLIGDAAIQFRLQHADDGWRFLDLGEEWMRCTGLPFVFACWIFRPGFEPAEPLANLLRSAKRSGLMAIEEFAAKSENPDFVREYFGRHVRYDLRTDERKAIELFGTLLRKHGHVDVPETKIRYV